jgi:CubicO group peptidase (beta-lactamase class C family)
MAPGLRVAILGLVLAAAPPVVAGPRAHAAEASRAAAEGGLSELVARILEEERTRAGAPAMSVAVVDREGVRAVHAAGLADPETGRAATPATRFPAASISKLVTAALVMQQAEAGRLDLGAPVNERLPETAWVRDADGAPVPATLRQLLGHHAGLPISWVGIAHLPGEPATLAEHVGEGLRVQDPPGVRVTYANGGFSLAGWIAMQAEADGEAEGDASDWDAFARGALLAPLGMAHSSFRPPGALAAEGVDVAACYGGLFGGRERCEHIDVSATAPAGGLVTTASDLARFARMVLREGELDGVRVLAPGSVRRMLRLQASNHPDLGEGFGLGFGIRERPGRRVAWWDGSLAGAAARLALLPEHGVGVVVLSSLADNTASSLAANRILAALVPPAPPEAYAPSADERAALLGRWRLRDMVDPRLGFLQLFMVMEVRDEEGTLRADAPVLGGALALHPTGPGRFRLRGGQLDDANVLLADGRLRIGPFPEARRIGFWEAPGFVLAGLGLVLVGLLAAGLAFVVHRLRRRRRA